MSGDKSLSVNGQARVPPGFRFHPTEEELLHYYLRKKVAYQKIDLDVIRDIDLNKLEPWDIQEKCKIGSTPQNDWYFFSHKDKKYPTGTRTNRATAAGFWKATGRDKVIHTNFKRIGMRKTLVFYKGRAPHGQKSDWIMHEYRLEEHSHDSSSPQSNVAANSGGTAEASQEDGWVVCRVFKKKNHVKTNDSPNNSSVTIDMTNQMHLNSSSNDGALDHILQYMGRACKQETDQNRHNPQRSLGPVDTGNTHERFMQLPPLESPSTLQSPLPAADHPSTHHQSCYTPDVIPMMTEADVSTNSENNINHNNMNPVLFHVEPGLNDWATLDRLVASHLNVQADSSSLPFYSDPDTYQLRSTNRLCAGLQDFGNHGGDVDLWAFARSSSSDTLSHQMSKSAF